MQPLIIPLVSFFLVIVVLAAIRGKLGAKFDIKNGDIVLALIPVALWLLSSGTIKEFAFGDLKIVTAIKEVSNASVEPQVAHLPVEGVQLDAKGGVGNIGHLIERKTEALGFQLGHGGYVGSAIKKYLDELTAYPYLRYVVLFDATGKFFGMANARQIAAMFQSGGHRLNADRLASWINDADTKQLVELPGFVLAKDAVDQNADRRTALERMNAINSESLPVIDEDGRFIGIVDRSKLTASMLVDISDRLEGNK